MVMSGNVWLLTIQGKDCSITAMEEANELRKALSKALSAMYAIEVPRYGDLLDIVRHVDTAHSRDSQLPKRHWLERHGAIRVGTAWELQMFRRFFKLLGMHPVGYYDISVAGLPLHATAFRPIDYDALEENPFRIFTSMIRMDLLSPPVKATAERILQTRHLFKPALQQLIEKAEMKASARLPFQDACNLIEGALDVMKWHSYTDIAFEEYRELYQAHPVIADAVCFPCAHINHLTPCTLDIDQVQLEMVQKELPVKTTIEGPPRRRCPILLRQTSFKALEEAVYFRNTGSDELWSLRSHTARFGEVEQRGAAVTRKGRALYDHLLSQCHRTGADWENLFLAQFPDTWERLHDQGLVYFRYSLTEKALHLRGRIDLGTSALDMQHLVDLGLVEYKPIIYEDFLPFSAAGIFKSNLGTISQNDDQVEGGPRGDAEGFEQALGCEILDPFQLYNLAQQQSVLDCICALGLDTVRDQQGKVL